MSHLVLVKHSLPTMEPEMPAHAWRLSDEGRRRCEPLARRLAAYTPAALASSREPKAVETAHFVAPHLGAQVRVIEGLHEHDRGNVGLMPAGAFETAVAEFFRNPDRLVLGCETADQAHARFAGAVGRLLQEHAASNLVVVAHGTVISLFVARLLGWEPFPLWRRLGLPSFVVLSHSPLSLVTFVENVEHGGPAPAEGNAGR